MVDMVDPSNSLASFQVALNNNLITLTPCLLHPEMKVLQDNAEGTPRLTYALLDGEKVKGIAIYVPVEPIEGTLCFGLGYAVAEQYRKQGVASEIVQKSLEEIHACFKRHIPKFYVEAIVGIDNYASNKVASKFLSQEPKACDDSCSGKPAQQYVRFLE
ncbi:GNAT family N-acetyltransferase [Atlantibacter hermannii]|uniref:GNAT family N-acetyltransferase n=1 Tax=Atlantibacter hermannii TaxID=565 RepID=UPI002FD96953